MVTLAKKVNLNKRPLPRYKVELRKNVTVNIRKEAK